MRNAFLVLCAAAALALGLAPVAGAQYTDYRQAAGDQYHQPSAAAAKVCVSKRKFTLAVRGPHGRPILKASVTLNGHKLKVRRLHGRSYVVVDLRGRGAGVVNVRIRGSERGARRKARTRAKRYGRARKFSRTRRFSVCAKATARTVVVSGRPASAGASSAGGLGAGGVLAVLALSALGAGALATAGHRGTRRLRRR